MRFLLYYFSISSKYTRSALSSRGNSHKYDSLPPPTTINMVTLNTEPDTEGHKYINICNLRPLRESFCLIKKLVMRLLERLTSCYPGSWKVGQMVLPLPLRPEGLHWLIPGVPPPPNHSN